MLKVFYFACLISSLFFSHAFASELYRYQDSKGRWVFGDKESLNNQISVQDTEKITINDHRQKRPKPSMTLEKQYEDGRVVQNIWTLFNPLPVSVQHWLSIKGQKGFITSVLTKPLQHSIITDTDLKLKKGSTDLEHYYLLGEPIDRPSGLVISPPYRENKSFRISQGFNGKFSHTGRGSRYAIDIAMPVGEPVLAVKDGIVADARDDFSMGGAASYFLDKANHVTVMHADGSYAIYAHILYGSLGVKLGQKIKAGQYLAKIGSTGFSTGPHLHFVMRYNSGQGAYSIPFKFKQGTSKHTPQYGKFYLGELPRIN